MEFIVNDVPRSKLSLAAFLVLAAQGSNADDIRIINANKVTMDDASASASTLLIRENRIVSVSDEAPDSDAAGGDITVIDYIDRER